MLYLVRLLLILFHISCSYFYIIVHHYNIVFSLGLVKTQKSGYIKVISKNRTVTATDRILYLRGV